MERTALYEYFLSKHNITLPVFVYLWEGRNISVSPALILSSKHWHNCSCPSQPEHSLFLQARASAGNMSYAELQATYCIKYTGGKKGNSEKHFNIQDSEC